MAGVTRNPRPLFVTALPSAPSDGMEVYYQSTTAGTGGGASDTMATTGAVWHLRYRAAGGTYKWEMVGGSALDVTSTTSPTNITATTPTSLSTNPILTLPTAGTYRLEVFANGAAITVASKTAFLSIDFSGGMTETAVASGGAVLYSTTTTSVSTLHATYLKTITGASTVLTMKAWVDSGGTFYPSNATTYPYGIRATPIRVG